MSMQFTPYLMLNGEASAAIAFYRQALGAEVVFSQTHGASPEDPAYPVPTEAKDWIAHAVLHIGGAGLMIADKLPWQPHSVGNHVTICITTENAEITTRFYDALRDGGRIDFPLQPIYFSPAYGMVTDRFGVTFQVFTKAQR